jgi:glucose/mannose transport system permease protein
MSADHLALDGTPAAAIGNPRAHGRKPRELSAARVGIYAFLVISALFFLVPLYIMVVTSLKTMPEIRLGHLFNFPAEITFKPWSDAWLHACTGRDCTGLHPGFVNSVKITIPSVVISILIGSLNGYALSFWRYKGANLMFGILLFGAFVPYQVVIYPLIIGFRMMGIFSTLTCIIIVTGIWNDFLFGIIFSGRPNWPMTVQLNNIVNTTTGVREYNVNMAATILTAAVPLVIYFVSGRWFVRGIAAGAVKG